MSSAVNRELADAIAQQVLTTLGRGGAAAENVSAPAPAARPPAQSPPRPAKPGAVSRLIEGDCFQAGRIFLTAQMLAQRIGQGKPQGGTIDLAHNEHLTPGARDLLAMRDLTVRRAPKPTPADFREASGTQQTGEADTPADAPCPPIGLVLDRPGPQVRGVLAWLRREGAEMTCFDRQGCLLGNMQEMCRAVSSGEPALGVAILKYGASATMLANKVGGVRAVQGTRIESVKAAVRHFDANVLILEYAFSTYHELKKMIQTFTRCRPQPPADNALIEAARRLERT